MSDFSSSGMSVHDRSIQRPKDYKIYSKTAHEWYLASALYDGVEDGNFSQLSILLINKGANPNVVLPEHGLAPIHLAVGCEDIKFGCEATKLFLSHGGDPNVRSSDGLTPVHVAALWGRNFVLKLLLANGGDPWITDNDNKNAFSHAHDQQQWETFKLLDSFKNSIILERPDVSRRTHYKLRLDRVKVFNNDICAEYKALPMSSRCCSTQTPPSRSKKNSLSVVSSKYEQDVEVEKSSIRIPSPPAIDVTVNKSYDFEDDSFNLKLNVCPNKQELQALELVKQHRQGITVFEYVPESGYQGDNENINEYREEGSSRCSIDNNSLAGSLNSLVRGSVFADVKSKLKLFYKNVSGGKSNKDNWRTNLIQKKKDKETLKKDTEVDIKKVLSAGSFTDRSLQKKCKETCSDIANYMQSKSSSNVIKYDNDDDYNKTDDSASEVESCCSKKSRSSLWRLKITNKYKKSTLKSNVDSQSNSFHRFEDVIDSYNFDDLSNAKNDRVNTSSEICNKKDDSSEKSGICICEGICMDILRRINSQTCNTNEIGFLVNKNSNINCHENVSDNLLLYGLKKDVGFYFDEPLKSNGDLIQKEKVLKSKSDDIESISAMPETSNDLGAEVPQEKDVEIYDTCNRSAQFGPHKFDDSNILTEDEIISTNAFDSFKAKNIHNKNATIADNSNLNSTKTSATDIYYSCTSVDHSKEISNKNNLTEISENGEIVNARLSQKHMECITIYESDHTSETSLKDVKEREEMLNTAFNDSKCITSSTPEKELGSEICFLDSTTAVAGSPQTSLSEQYDDLSIISNDNNRCDPNSPSGDHKLSPELQNENLSIIPRIKIPNDSSSGSEVQIPKFSCTRTYSLQPIESKWTCVDLISSDEETDVSIIEEYLYTDEEEGIELVEERHLPARNSREMTKQLECINKENETNNGQQLVEKKSTRSGTESESALSSVDTAYETDALRRELKEFGFNAGPITGGTKRIYLRQLKRARRKPIAMRPLSPRPDFSPELERLVRNDKKDLIENWSHLEIEMSKPFLFPDPNKRWREGVAKTSFTYLLLDPRVTQDLPYRANSLGPKERLNCFLQAIFYVGRGKRARPYSHLTEALAVWNRWRHVSSKKVNRILDIWGSGLGVVCLHVFQNVIPVEAMTREAAMIDALGLQVLCNERVGDYYAVASTWNLRQRQQLGAVLLVRALNILISEGERQIRPPDIG